MQQRDMEVAAEIKDHGSAVDVKKAEEDNPKWSSKAAQEEADFQKKKLHKKKMEEYVKQGHGSLLPEEIDTVTPEEAEAYLKKEETDKAR